ncbi:MAG: AbrB/MazE/SpoVT family DNA-binding domain-containing protein [Euryarchaeota archaeon]|jgi:antitoxin component of MazEF toxin-antitoxin module|nr:AbrB/MazE/SpoVT family DNA-binding domain-containing protein [Euryarchaeota archaeon]
MARYKRKLIQLGNKSLVVTIPWEIVETLGLKKGERVYVSLDDNKRTITVSKGSEETE